MMTEGFCYVDMNDIEEGAVVIQPDTGQTFKVGTQQCLPVFIISTRAMPVLPW